MYTYMTGCYTTTINGHEIPARSRTYKKESVVAAKKGTVAKSDGVWIGVATIGYSRRATDRAAAACRGMRVVGRDFTAVEEDVGASVPAEQHATGGRGTLIALDSKVLENIILHIHKRNCAENIGTCVCMVVRDNHRVHVIALESDRILC